MDQRIVYFMDQRLCFILVCARSFVENTDSSYPPQKQTQTFLFIQVYLCKIVAMNTLNAYT